MKKNRAIKLLVGIIAVVVNAFSLPECYSAKIPITDTPLYKYVIKKSKIAEPQKQKVRRQQIQQEKPQKTAETTTNKLSESSKKPADKQVDKPEDKWKKKPINRSTFNSAYRQLKKHPDLSEIHSNMAFSDAIDIYRNSTESPLNIIVLWKDIEENTDVDRYTPIGIEPISGISLGKNLELMLMAVSSDPKSLGYIVEKGTIIIGRRDSLRRKPETRIYDLTDLLGQPANYFTPVRAPMPYGGAYGGYGYGGYGMTNGSYGGARMYGGFGYGGPSIMGGYRTQVGRIRTGTSLNVNP